MELFFILSVTIDSYLILNKLTLGYQQFPHGLQVVLLLHTPVMPVCCEMRMVLHMTRLV